MCAMDNVSMRCAESVEFGVLTEMGVTREREREIDLCVWQSVSLWHKNREGGRIRGSRVSERDTHRVVADVCNRQTFKIRRKRRRWVIATETGWIWQMTFSPSTSGRNWPNLLFSVEVQSSLQSLLNSLCLQAEERRWYSFAFHVDLDYLYRPTTSIHTFQSINSLPQQGKQV